MKLNPLASLVGVVAAAVVGFHVFTAPATSPITLTLAAYNSDQDVKDRADIVCDGTDDDLTINAAVNGGSARGEHVVLMDGWYLTSDHLTISRSNVTLSGSSHAFWGGYVHGWDGSTNGGLPAIAGAVIKQTGSAHDGLVIDTTADPMADGRKKAIKVEFLAFEGRGTNSWSHTGISGGSDADFCVIAECSFRNFEKGIDVALDSPVIDRNNIQDCSGDGITMTGGHCTNNLIWDIGGVGITAYGHSQENFTGNEIGSCPIGIYLDPGSASISVCGNDISWCNTGILTKSGNSHAITGNTFNGCANGVNVGPVWTTSGCTISGNTFNLGFASSGYAINFNSSSGNTAVGNTIRGGYYHSGSSTTINAGSGNTVGLNNGDDH